MKAVHWGIVAAVAGMVGWMVFDKHQADAGAITRLDVFAACEVALRDASGDASAVVPFVEPIEGRSGWVVAWSKGSGLRLAERGGEESTGSCMFTGGRVERLAIDEKRIIDAFVRVPAAS